MANIRVDVNFIIADGAEVVFEAPCDCSEVTGLSVYYRDALGEETFKTFSFKDANGNDLSDLDNLFSVGAYVKVILSVTDSSAYIQNADTNAYLEGKFDAIKTESENYTDSKAFETLLDAKEYVDSKVDAIIGEGASETLDTIGEISKAFEEHQEVTEAINEAIGKKANATDLTEHTGNKSNPHGVTKIQVGLGNVPNVATNDQTPTFTVASDNAELISGEKLSVAFGKIAKAIKSLIAHLKDDKSHIPTPQTANKKTFLRNDNTWQVVTPANIGAAPSSHEQSASTISAGTFKGKVVGNATAVATLGDKQFRNIYVGEADLTSGSSTLPTGDIYIKFKRE